MVARNSLMDAPPYPVERTMLKLGWNLRIARIRRKMTIAEVAERIGTGPRAVMDAEKGKGSSGIATYAALLWLYGLLDQMEQVGDPALDKEGLTLELSRAKTRVRKEKGLDNDF